MSVFVARDQAPSRAEASEPDRLRALVAALEASLEKRHAALIQLDRTGRIAHATGQARELLAAYADGPRALGVLVHDELRELWLSGPRGRLRVRRIESDHPDGWHGLLLEERRTSVPRVESLRELGLTHREAQVLRLLTHGKRNQQIARELQISAATVRKHLQHIYAHLGVSSRAEAVAHALA